MAAPIRGYWGLVFGVAFSDDIARSMLAALHPNLSIMLQYTNPYILQGQGGRMGCRCPHDGLPEQTPRENPRPGDWELCAAANA